MTAYQLNVVKLDEIDHVAVRCTCGAVVQVPAGQLVNLDNYKCFCGKTFDDGLVQMLQGLRAAIQNVGNTKLKIEFHLKQ